MRILPHLPVAVLVAISTLSLLACGVQAESDSDKPVLETAPQGLKSGTSFTLKPMHSGQCLNIDGASMQAGAVLTQQPCNGAAHQLFTAVATGDGSYNIKASHSGLCLEAHFNTWGMYLYQWTCHGGENEKFWLQDRGNGYYQIRAKYTGLCLDVSGASYSAGATVVQWGCSGNTNQLFYLGLPARSSADKNLCTNGLGEGKNCKPDVQISGIVPYANCEYGFHLGAGWGSGTSAYYDELDRCSLWHDLGCWNVNRYTGVDEGGGGCTQTVNFINCVERVVPSTQEEAAARACVLQSLLASGANICEPFGRGTFYPLYDPSTSGGSCGSGWLYPSP